MIDPKIRKCQCGHSWYFTKYHYIKMILFGKIKYRCPNCQRTHQYKLIYHPVEEHNATQNENKLLVRDWKNG